MFATPLNPQRILLNTRSSLTQHIHRAVGAIANDHRYYYNCTSRPGSRGQQFLRRISTAPTPTLQHPNVNSHNHNHNHNMTTAVFKHIDVSSQPEGTKKPWSKVDADVASFSRTEVTRDVSDLRAQDPAAFTTDTAGFSLHKAPTASTPDWFFPATTPTEDKVRGAYYAEIETLLREQLPTKPSRIVIFDHTIRRRTPDALRTPVQQVHVDQTSGAAAARVRRHVLDPEDAERLLRGRYQIVNVWRPIGHAASDMPLGVVDWRSTTPADFVPVDLLYPLAQERESADGDRNVGGRERRADKSTWHSTEGYEVRGETLGVLANPAHRFYYAPDMRPDEVLFLKCYDSFGQGELPHGRPGLAVGSPHTAFVDPKTPPDAPPRQSIEVRCLVFYD